MDPAGMVALEKLPVGPAIVLPAARPPADLRLRSAEMHLPQAEGPQLEGDAQGGRVSPLYFLTRCAPQDLLRYGRLAAPRPLVKPPEGSPKPRAPSPNTSVPTPCSELPWSAPRLAPLSGQVVSGDGFTRVQVAAPDSAAA